MVLNRVWFPMLYVLLLCAILIEVGASLALKASDGFVRVVPSALALAGFGLSLLMLARVSAVLPIGLTYPTWAGLGIVGATIGGVVLFGERVSAQGMVALAIIVAGIALLHAPTLGGAER